MIASRTVERLGKVRVAVFVPMNGEFAVATSLTAAVSHRVSNNKKIIGSQNNLLNYLKLGFDDQNLTLRTVLKTFH